MPKRDVEKIINWRSGFEREQPCSRAAITFKELTARLEAVPFQNYGT